MSGETPPLLVDINVRLRVGGQVLNLQGRLPGDAASLPDLLPAIQTLTDAVVAVASHEAETHGRRISCGAGCGACCRQLVPIGEAEATYLATLIASMPSERRAAIEQRFREALALVARSGLLASLQDRDASAEPGPRRELGLAYFGLAIPCPFLENESCSIHAHRPLACREYLVTSPASDCADPVCRRVEVVSLPHRPSSVLFRFSEGDFRAKPRWLPLLALLERSGQHPDRARPLPPAPILFERFLHALTRSIDQGVSSGTHSSQDEDVL